MPYTHPPICFICKKVHSCDTQDTLQLENANYVTVNVCKCHQGIQEEYDRQNNLSLEEAAEHARKTISTPEFKKTFTEYTSFLIEQHPQHKEHLESFLKIL